MSRTRRLSSNELERIVKTCSLGPGYAKKIEIRFLRRTHNSLLYLASSTDAPHTLLIKQVRTGDAGAQYRALVSGAGKMKEGVYRVPRPIAYISKENIIIMEYIKSNSLEMILLNKNTNELDKRKYIKLSAQWLSNFHAAYKGDSKIIDSVNKAADLSNILPNIQEILSKNPDLMSVFCWLESTAEYMQSRQTVFGYTHGDYKPENILCSEEKIYGIDLFLEEEGAQLMDLVQYTNHLLFLTMRYVGKPYYKYINEWTDCFLESYTENQGAIDREIFFWLRMQHLMRYWFYEVARKNPVALLQAYKLRKEISALFQSVGKIGRW